VTWRTSMGFLRPGQRTVIVAHEDSPTSPERELARIRRKGTMCSRSGALFELPDHRENILFSLELRGDYDAENKEEVCKRHC